MPSSIIHDKPFWYFLPDGVGEIEFPVPILEYFVYHQQRHLHDKEAGGQIFWEYALGGHRRVAEITGPRLTDQRSRSRYKADHRQEQIEIDECFERGLYLLGDWHTHPEPVPTPSTFDIETIKEIYRTSSNPGPGFLLVIVGTKPLHEGLSVSWCNEKVVAISRLDKSFIEGLKNK